MGIIQLWMLWAEQHSCVVVLGGAKWVGKTSNSSTEEVVSAGAVETETLAEAGADDLSLVCS